MKKSLGGDRLGSGSKMEVDLHNYSRSTHDLGYAWRSTMGVGTLVPFLCEVGLPGDTFDINLDCLIRTHPTIGPLFGSDKIQLDIFQAPIRLYQGQLHNNKLKIGMNMAQVKLPVANFNAVNPDWSPGKDIDNAQVNPSALPAYLGIRGIGNFESGALRRFQPREFNGVALLAYWDIYKQYYANKQEEIGFVIHKAVGAQIRTVTSITIDGTALAPAPETSIGAYLGMNSSTQKPSLIRINFTGTRPLPSEIVLQTEIGPYAASTLASEIKDGVNIIDISYDYNRWGRIQVINWTYAINTQPYTGQPQLVPFDLDNIDTMRERILQHSTSNTAFSIAGQNLAPYSYLFESYYNETQQTLYTPLTSSQEGLGIKTYQSDLFNNWLSTEWIDGENGISAVTAVNTEDGSFTIDTLNLAKKVYDMLNRIAVSGGTYDDWLNAVYTHDQYTRAESPIYHGGLIKELVFQEVVSTAGLTGAEPQPLGTLAGKGVMSQKHKGGNVYIRIDEPSYIIGIISITPRIDYSQGNRWDTGLKTMDDLHKPALDEIGFEDAITERQAWWDTYFDEDDQDWTQRSAGKQPAWMNYRTNYNRTYGNFAIRDNQMWMTNNRRYEYDGAGYTIKDLTTYIDPAKYNYIFAETSIDAQNYWVQVGVDMSVRRKMSARIMPNL